ncbi:hypothetical protein IEQ34_007629 [Dendrobium chrysotoxum]|uniref:Uncharacterized protein n=1 Tax=Dendrobium chrysotoxum TaxID=161865 RepID=A0AAV7H2C9_DENCH|nr:hypothetical protein IEQ34_007629 [Dendrobium chrysotoxum]
MDSSEAFIISIDGKSYRIPEVIRHLSIATNNVKVPQKDWKLTKSQCLVENITRIHSQTISCQQGRGTSPLTGSFAVKWHCRINGYDSGPSEPGGRRQMAPLYYGYGQSPYAPQWHQILEI